LATEEKSLLLWPDSCHRRDLEMTQNDPKRPYAEFLDILRRPTELLNEATAPDGQSPEGHSEELFSVERLEQYASRLAVELEVSSRPTRGRASLLSVLKKDGRKLVQAYLKLADSIRAKQSVSPAAEWFVDNFHIIEDRLREIRQDLPDDYYHGLPKLAAGELKGYPRVYAIALAIIAHTDSRLDADALRRFLIAYQQVAPLTIGELWAIAITLRIALFEHLTPIALRIVSAREKRAKADALAERLLALAVEPETTEKELVRLLARELGDPKRFDRALIVQLIQRIRDQDPAVWPAFDWLEKQLASLGTSAERVTQLEHYRQASSQVTVGNIIASMRLLSSMDWREFFESVSLIDRQLERDPAGAYRAMDFGTRDRYRHAVERVAKRSRLGEREVVERALELSQPHSAGSRMRHVGYSLIGEGKRELERAAGYRPRLREWVSRVVHLHPGVFYLCALAFFIVLFLVPVLAYYAHLGAGTWALAAFAALAALPASELALSLLHHYVNFFVHPVALPRMETEKGIPAGAKTLIVIPTLFTSERGVRALVERLEIHALANLDPELSYALLGDFGDAVTEHAPTDERLLEIARDGIAALNERHWAGLTPRFHLFHRRRQWNASENKWIGWERKRGKLLEFNRLLRGATDTSYIVATADPAQLKQIQFVITLDSDTQLPRDAARKLVGTILHPLNRPQYDSRKGRVTAGYGILQPRISITAASAAATRFARAFSGNIGLDPYTTAVSDVYQDLFEEGTFTGKGLYVVDSFELAMENRVPENAVLSHDLFESSYARSALVTDVELFDDYPADYDTYSSRQHRWIRGDWQIGPWLFPRVPRAGGGTDRNPLSLVSRWKIFDNLRRSLVAPASMVWLAAAWTVLPGAPGLWTALVALMFLFPVYSTFVTGRWLNRRGITWRGHIAKGVRDTRVQLGQIFLTLAFLPQQAWTAVDAIARVFYRKLISHRGLLEWMAFGQSESRGDSPVHASELAGPGPLTAFVLGTAAGLLRPEALPVAAPFILTWLLSPWLKRWIARRPRTRRVPLGATERAEYRGYARRTWSFFETFVTAEGHWLAPDNFQEDPHPVVAHRTSPTNIGLQLLSMGSAYDLGYVGRHELIESVEKTFATLGKLAGMHGHFFNWYDTRTLEPLNPRYVSTVDSGNLAGHLLTFKQFLLEIGRIGRRTDTQLRHGVEDTLRQLELEVAQIGVGGGAAGAVTGTQLRAAVAEALSLCASPPGAADGGSDWLAAVAHQVGEAHDILEALATGEELSQFTPARLWMAAALRQTRELQRDAAATDEDLAALAARGLELTHRCDEIVLGMDFGFLFDERRKLFVIGYNATDNRQDNSYYDLLASESRLASFVAIAKGDVPQAHWFRLGRQMAPVQGGRALIAWTATMFEYLMPVLVMRRYADTLLDQTYEAVVERQIEYGREKGVPWGVSEAGFNARDLQLNYQYGPFGIPGLGLKRGLSDELVVSPYSTFLAALIDPWAALLNLRELTRLGALSRFGFHESIDYTAERLPKKQKSFILRSYMAHHQGMSLVAIGNILHDSAMQRRFHADPLVRSTQLLLQERIPQKVALSRPRAEEVQTGSLLYTSLDPNPRSYSDVNLSSPRTQLLSNGTYSVLVTSTGAGYSRCGPLAVTRWREDATRDHWGQFLYIRDLASGSYWSAAYQPTAARPIAFEASLAEDKVEFIRRDERTTTQTEILVSPEDNVELRRVSVTNGSRQPRDYEITSFMETVLAKPADDQAHPAFSNLFVQTEYVAGESALLATRRTRARGDAQPWAFHVLVADGEVVGPLQYETDRARFLGRGRDASEPAAISDNLPLSATVGSVLDPIFSLRRTVRVAPGATARLTFATGVARSRDEALGLADKYHDVHIFAREAEIAWTQSQVQLRHLNITSAKAHTYQKLAGRILYLDSALRARGHVLAQNIRAQSSLWAYGISGDLPILLTRINDEKDMAMVRELLHAHEYLRLKGLAIDLVILNERAPSYLQSLQDELQRQIRMSGSQALLDKPGGVFLRRTDLMPKEDVVLLRTVARVTLNADRGTLDEQLKYRNAAPELPPELAVSTPFFGQAVPASSAPAGLPRAPRLEFFNGVGGFTSDAREYVTVLNDGQWTPAPWANVVANRLEFGFVVSESGSGYTWSANSRENRLTPWSNDPVSDPVGEAIYVRDEETGEYWSPTPLPIRGKGQYVISHGQGYSRFEHVSHGIEHELTLFVAGDAEVKVSRLRLKNPGATARKLSVTSYTEWVLGAFRAASAPYVIAECDPDTGAILARNPYNNEFAARVAFADFSETDRTFTCDRKEFIGRNGSHARPAALTRVELSGASGAGLDPCAAFHAAFELAPGEERVVLVILGQAETVEAARALTRRFRAPLQADRSLAEARAGWERTVGALEIRTPDAAMNTLVNRWLPYQTLSCRLWARSGFYQSGGAYGFRDQLQDVMALVYSHPELARQQILRAAARQFPQGDVQHWWHPPTGRGVRTHFSDDLLWLPFVTSYYIRATGDQAVLEESVPFIEGPELAPGQDDSYTHPQVSTESASLREHCARALDRSLKVGAHGLPLMGSGDWNDGMNRVGHEGRGESVWVGWFLYAAIEQFIPLCEKAEGADFGPRIAAYRAHLLALKAAIEGQAWDGDWYRRAYFDDGTPLGSAESEECRIDSIAQSWSVLSGAGDPERSRRAMAALDVHLVQRENGLIRLFTPPFDRTTTDPGYIKGYVPGVRENGGQYTHAAIWAVMAYAELGDGDRAGELFALLNPINHSSTRAGLYKYKVEPYVVAADVYGMAPHTGRGGWTWYTGSASWMYRAAVESILGFELNGERFRLRPRIPRSWRGFEMTYASYRIVVTREEGQPPRVTLDGQTLPTEWVPFKPDGKPHEVTVRIS
jgi:cyclic beta-1,2-glucan synthetase